MNDFDESKPENYMMYWEANNLYGYAMSEALPSKNLQFNTDVTLEDILNTDDNNDVGYTVEVDLHFPEEIHDKLKEYPVRPENTNVKEECLSDYQKQLLKELKMKNSKCDKLIPHLHDHNNYVFHHRNLKCVKELGVEIKLNKVISFEQKPWLKS